MQKPDRAKMVALLHLAANEGPPFNRPDRCRRLSPDEFSEFKTHGHRILWVTKRDTIIMMTAFEKKQQKTPEAEKIRGTTPSRQSRRSYGIPTVDIDYGEQYGFEHDLDYQSELVKLAIAGALADRMEALV